MKITVTGTKPNGQSIPGGDFCDLRHLVSPQSTLPSYDWADGLFAVADMLKNVAPYGIGNFITAGQEVNGGMLEGYTITQDRGSTSAWKKYTPNMLLPALGTERGLQFGFDLRCDDDLPGTYTINVLYEIKVLYSIGGVDMIETESFTQQVTYVFWGEATKGYASTVVKDTTATAGGGTVYNPSNMQGIKADGQFGEIYSGGYNCHATAIATMTNLLSPGNGITGHVYIYGWSQITGGKGSHVYVYGSMSNTCGWFIIKEFYTNKNTPYYIDCGTSSTSFKYLAIACMNDDIVSNIYVDSIGVYN